MAERDKLNAISKGSLKHQQDMAAMQRGAAMPGVLIPTAAPPAKEPDWDKVDPTGARHIDDDIAAQQAANLKAAKTDPGMQEKLNAVAKARAEYYREGI